VTGLKVSPPEQNTPLMIYKYVQSPYIAFFEISSVYSRIALLYEVVLRQKDHRSKKEG
jgi:hypothetical protein